MAKPSLVTNVVVVNNLDATNSRRFFSTTISWSAAPSTENVVSYRVYRNFAPYGTFTLIATVTAPTVTYTDNLTLNSTSFGINEGITQAIEGFWYYRVSAVNNIGEESDRSAPVSYEENDAYLNDPFTSGYTVGDQMYGFTPETACDMPSNDGLNDYFNRIRSANMWLLLNNGQDVWLFKRRKEGTKCPHWQEDAQDCPYPLGKKENLQDACYGTGFVGGYYEPVRIKMRLVSAQSRVTLEKEGMRIDNSPKAWTIWTPRLANFDFFVTSDGSRYEIKSVNRYNARGGLITHQDCEIIRKWETDLIYKVPVPETLI